MATEIAVQLHLQTIPHFTTLQKAAARLSDTLLHVAVGRFIQNTCPGRIFAGCDAEWVHQMIRRENTASMIPARSKNLASETRGHYRKLMRREFDESLYHQRNKTEAIFSL